MLSRSGLSFAGLGLFFFHLSTFSGFSAEYSHTSSEIPLLDERIVEPNNLINLTPGDDIVPTQNIAWKLSHATNAASDLSKESELASPEASNPKISSLSKSGLALHLDLHPIRLSSRQNNPQLLTQNQNSAPNIVNPINNGRIAGNNITTNSRNVTNRIRNFNETVQIPGGFVRVQSTWTDGLRIDTISATSHALVIRREMQTSSPKFVTSADPSRSFLGGDWRELTNFSYVISFDNETPDDLSFKISVPYDRIQPPITPPGPDDDIYLGVFDQNRGGWVIDTERMDIRRREKRVDLIAIPAPSAEYRLLLRTNRNQAPLYMNFGNGTDGQFNVLPFLGGVPAPLQVGTWEDGSKVMIRSVQSMQITMETRNISTNAIPSGYESATLYSVAITTTAPAAAVIMNLQLQYVPTQLQDKKFRADGLLILGRPLRTSRSYQVLSATTISGNGALMNTPMNVVEGEYFLAVRV